MSPEALKRVNITTASDIYSLGITMWQLKTRIYPYSSIDSNDIVAYRVVKENLRPDNLNLEINNITLSQNSNKKSNILNSNRHSNCLCEHFSSDLSQHSIENFQRILKSSKSLETSISLLNLLNENKRIPFMNLNKKLNIQSCNNITKNNNKKEQLSKIIKNNVNHLEIPIMITTPNGNEKIYSDDKTNKLNDKMEEKNIISTFETVFDLKSIFQSIPVNHKISQSSNSNTILLNEIENDIEILYRNCWHKDIHERPNATDTQNILKNILNKISKN